MAIRYTVDTDNFTEALAQIVATFRAENPSIGVFSADCKDGTKITIRAPKLKSPKPARRA